MINTGPYTLKYEDLSDGWVRAQVAEQPEVAAEAPTRAEAREMTLTALIGLLHASSKPESAPPRPILAA